jgi:protoheme IX farnesyltransferase
MLPCGLGFAGTTYGAAAAVGGTIFLVLALQLSRSRESDSQTAHRLFGFSIVYLFVLFAALLAGSGGGRSPLVSARATAAGPVAAGSQPCSARTTRGPVRTSEDEA